MFKTLEELLNTKSFLLLQNPTSKKMVFDNICNKAVENLNIDKNFLLNNLIKREKIGSTTIGNGIAIPHIQNIQIFELIFKFNSGVAYIEGILFTNSEVLIFDSETILVRIAAE